LRSYFDQRQLEKMSQLIKSFKRMTLSLSSFVSSLEFLFYALEHTDDVWEDLFLEEISTLESVNSGVSANITEREVQEIVDEAVINLDKLVNEYLCKTD